MVLLLSRLRIFQAKHSKFEIILLGYYVLRAATKDKTGKTKTVSVSVLTGFCGAKHRGNSGGNSGSSSGTPTMWPTFLGSCLPNIYFAGPEYKNSRQNF